MADPNIKDEKPAHTRIVINTFPEMHLGQPFIPQHGCTLNFIGQDGKTYFQVQLFFRVMNYNTKEPMYEFRTCSDYFWDDDLDSPAIPILCPLLLRRYNPQYLTLTGILKTIKAI